MCRLLCKRRLCKSRKSFDCLVHCRNDLGRRAFLRAIDGGAARGTRERICDVAGDGKVAFTQDRRKAAEIDACDLGNVFAIDAGRRAVRTQESRAERCHHAEAGVIRRAAAEADEERAAAARCGRKDELAEAVRRRVHRIALFGRHHRQASRVRHFDDRRLLCGQETEAALGFRAERSSDLRADEFSVQALDERIDRALAAVSERENLRVAFREDRVNGFRDDAAAFEGRDAAFERIHGDDEMFRVHVSHLCFNVVG